MNRKKATISNCLSRQKALRVRFCEQQDRTLFLSPKKPPDKSDLFISESHESVNHARAASAYGGSLIEVDGKGLVSPNR